MNVRNALLTWSVPTASLILFALCRYFNNSKMPLQVLIKMHPMWCNMTSLSGATAFTVTENQYFILMVFSFTVLVLCWTYFEHEAALAAEAEVKREEEESVEEAEHAEELLKSTQSLLGNTEELMNCCKMALAADNERVGGEAEWATGETSSEEGDVVREAEGRRRRKLGQEAETHPETDCEDVQGFLSVPRQRKRN